MVVDLREDNLKEKNVWVAKPKSPHTVLREHGACASAAIRRGQASTALLRQRSRRSGVKERGFPKGENSRGGSPLWFPPLACHIRKRNEKLPFYESS